MADRVPVDVILPCLDEADAMLPDPLTQSPDTWWPAVPADGFREDPAAPAPDPGRAGRDGRSIPR
jgi:hypothetical protein